MRKLPRLIVSRFLKDARDLAQTGDEVAHRDVETLDRAAQVVVEFGEVAHAAVEAVDCLVESGDGRAAGVDCGLEIAGRVLERALHGLGRAVHRVHHLLHHLALVLGALGRQRRGDGMVEPQLKPRFERLALGLRAEYGAQQRKYDGAGNADERGIERDAHTGERRHQSAADAVEHAQPLGGVRVADELGKRENRMAQAKEGTEQAERDEQRHGVCEKALAQQKPRELGADSV